MRRFRLRVVRDVCCARQDEKVGKSDSNGGNGPNDERSPYAKSGKRALIGS